MKTPVKKNASCREWLPPLRITTLAINAVCFGACVVLLAVRGANGPLVLLTIGTGLASGTGLAGAILGSRGSREKPASDR
jgi:hypothetical protein